MERQKKKLVKEEKERDDRVSDYDRAGEDALVEPDREPYLSALGSFLGRPVSVFRSHGKKIAVAAGALTLLWLGLARFGLVPSGDFSYASHSQWQAVFLANNQVYFGRLREYNSRYARLEEVFYLRPEQAGGANMNVVKLGDEVHGPENIMFIPKGQILFWENLRDDSQVVKIMQNAAR